MFKKILAAALIIMSLMTVMIPVSMAAAVASYRPYETPVTMYVNTQNGGPLNVRSTPRIQNNNLVGQLDFGAAVLVTGIDVDQPDWVAIRYARGTDGTAWVMTKYLSWTIPTPSKDQEEINRQMATYKAVNPSFTAAARPTSQEGWVNFRVKPGTKADLITTLKMGQMLTVIGETTDWYHAIDSVTGKIGFVMKVYTYRVN